MLFLLLLSCPLPTLSTCPSCKSVSGPGPLSGQYQLAGTEEQRCQDLCAYEREGELYCFERVSSSYQTQECSCVPCAEQCLDQYEASLYVECGGQCQLAQQPCGGACSAGAFLCGDMCMDAGYREQLLECGGACQGVDLPCNNTCQEGSKLCVENTLCVSEEDDMFKDCNGDCVAASAPCNGVCLNTTTLCGEECVAMANTTHTDCEGICQPVSLPCQASCAPGLMLCQGECVGRSSGYWMCQEECVPASTPCQGECAEGRYLVAGDCVETPDLCPDQDCLSDSDCQDQAGCFLYGDRFFCQCYLGWELDRSNSSTECPHTGSCAPAGQAGCEGAPCHHQGGLSVCPYCNATYDNITYQYTAGSGLPGDGVTGNIPHIHIRQIIFLYFRQFFLPNDILLLNPLLPIHDLVLLVRCQGLGHLLLHGGAGPSVCQ